MPSELRLHASRTIKTFDPYISLRQATRLQTSRAIGQFSRTLPQANTAIRVRASAAVDGATEAPSPLVDGGPATREQSATCNAGWLASGSSRRWRQINVDSSFFVHFRFDVTLPCQIGRASCR